MPTVVVFVAVASPSNWLDQVAKGPVSDCIITQSQVRPRRNARGRHTLGLLLPHLALKEEDKDDEDKLQRL